VAAKFVAIAKALGDAILFPIIKEMAAKIEATIKALYSVLKTVPEFP